MHYLQAVLISNCTSKPTFTVNALISYHGKRTYILSVLSKILGKSEKRLRKKNVDQQFTNSPPTVSLIVYYQSAYGVPATH